MNDYVLLDIANELIANYFKRSGIIRFVYLKKKSCSNKLLRYHTNKQQQKNKNKRGEKNQKRRFPLAFFFALHLAGSFGGKWYLFSHLSEGNE